jgi:GT2 family glycosyltransferase
MNWTALIANIPADVQLGFRTAYDSNVYYVRSRCLQIDLAGGDEVRLFNGEDYDYILWIDTDVLFQPADVWRLLADAESCDIVSGIYSQGKNSAETGEPEYSAILNMDDEYILKYGDYERLTARKIIALTGDGKRPVIEVTYCGMGFMLVKKGVFEKLGCLPFEPRRMEIKCDKIPGGALRGFCSEDTAFCLRAKDAGFRVCVDTGVVLGHEKMTVI